MSLPATPTHYWPLEASGAAALGGVDLTGGTGVTFDPTGGPFGGGCAVFPGTATGKFSCTPPAGLRLTGDRTILFWFKHNSGGGTQQTVVLLGFDFTLDWSIISSGGGMNFGAHPASGSVPVPTRGVGDWHLYCCRYRHAENQISVSFDDRLVIWRGPPAAQTQTGTGFFVGGYPDGTNPLASRLAHLAVYDRVLTEAEVGAYYRTLPGYVVQPLPYPAPTLTPAAPSRASFGGTATLTGPAPGTPLAGTSPEWHLSYTPGTKTIEFLQICVDGEYQDNVYRRGLDDTAVVWGAVTLGSSYRFALDTTEFKNGDHLLTLVGQEPGTSANVVLAEWPFTTSNGSAHRGIRPQFGSAAVPVGGSQAIAWSDWRCDDTTAPAAVLPTVYHDQNAAATKPNTFVKPHRDPVGGYPPGTLLNEIELTSPTSLTLHGSAGGFLQTDRARVYGGDEHRAVPVLPAHPVGYPHLGTGQRVLTAYTPGESKFARWMFNLTPGEFDAEPSLAAAALAAGVTAVQVPLTIPSAGTDWGGPLEPWLSNEKARIAALAARLRSLGFGAVVIGDTPFRHPGPPLTENNHPGGLQTLRAWEHGATALREIGAAWAASGVVHGTKMVDETGYLYDIAYWANPDNDADWAQARLQEGGFPLFAYTCLGWPPSATNGLFGGTQPFDQPYATAARCAFWSVGTTHNHQRDNSGILDLIAQGTLCAVRRCPPGRPTVANATLTRWPLQNDTEEPDWYGPEITLVSAGAALAMGVCGLDYYGYDHQIWQQERLQGAGQWGAKPGDPRWTAMAALNATIARFERHLLQPPATVPSWGPDWLVGGREGGGYRCLVAANPRTKSQPVPATAASGVGRYSVGTVVSTTGSADFTPGTAAVVPAGGVVVLAGEVGRRGGYSGLWRILAGRNRRRGY